MNFLKRRKLDDDGSIEEIWCRNHYEENGDAEGDAEVYGGRDGDGEEGEGDKDGENISQHSDGMSSKRSLKRKAEKVCEALEEMDQETLESRGHGKWYTFIMRKFDHKDDEVDNLCDDAVGCDEGPSIESSCSRGGFHSLPSFGPLRPSPSRRSSSFSRGAKMRHDDHDGTLPPPMPCCGLPPESGRHKQSSGRRDTTSSAAAADGPPESRSHWFRSRRKRDMKSEKRYLESLEAKVNTFDARLSEALDEIKGFRLKWGSAVISSGMRNSTNNTEGAGPTGGPTGGGGVVPKDKFAASRLASSYLLTEQYGHQYYNLMIIPNEAILVCLLFLCLISDLLLGALQPTTSKFATAILIFSALITIICFVACGINSVYYSRHLEHSTLLTCTVIICIFMPLLFWSQATSFSKLSPLLFWLIGGLTGFPTHTLIQVGLITHASLWLGFCLLNWPDVVCAMLLGQLDDNTGKPVDPGPGCQGFIDDTSSDIVIHDSRSSVDQNERRRRRLMESEKRYKRRRTRHTMSYRWTELRQRKERKHRKKHTPPIPEDQVFGNDESIWKVIELDNIIDVGETSILKTTTTTTSTTKEDLRMVVNPNCYLQDLWKFLELSGWWSPDSCDYWNQPPFLLRKREQRQQQQQSCAPMSEAIKNFGGSSYFNLTQSPLYRQTQHQSPLTAFYEPEIDSIDLCATSDNFNSSVVMSSDRFFLPVPPSHYYDVYFTTTDLEHLLGIRTIADIVLMVCFTLFGVILYHFICVASLSAVSARSDPAAIQFSSPEMYQAEAILIESLNSIKNSRRRNRSPMQDVVICTPPVTATTAAQRNISSCTTTSRKRGLISTSLLPSQQELHRIYTPSPSPMPAGYLTTDGISLASTPPVLIDARITTSGESYGSGGPHTRHLLNTPLSSTGPLQTSAPSNGPPLLRVHYYHHHHHHHPPHSSWTSAHFGSLTEQNAQARTSMHEIPESSSAISPPGTSRAPLSQSFPSHSSFIPPSLRSTPGTTTGGGVSNNLDGTCNLKFLASSIKWSDTTPEIHHSQFPVGAELNLRSSPIPSCYHSKLMIGRANKYNAAGDVGVSSIRPNYTRRHGDVSQYDTISEEILSYHNRIRGGRRDFNVMTESTTGPLSHSLSCGGHTTRSVPRGIGPEGGTDTEQLLKDDRSAFTGDSPVSLRATVMSTDEGENRYQPRELLALNLRRQLCLASQLRRQGYAKIEEKLQRAFSLPGKKFDAKQVEDESCHHENGDDCEVLVIDDGETHLNIGVFHEVRTPINLKTPTFSLAESTESAIAPHFSEDAGTSRMEMKEKVEEPQQHGAIIGGHTPPEKSWETAGEEEEQEEDNYHRHAAAVSPAMGTRSRLLLRSRDGWKGHPDSSHGIDKWEFKIPPQAPEEVKLYRLKGSLSPSARRGGKGLSMSQVDGGGSRLYSATIGSSRAWIGRSGDLRGGFRSSPDVTFNRRRFSKSSWRANSAKQETERSLTDLYTSLSDLYSNDAIHPKRRRRRDRRKRRKSQLSASIIATTKLTRGNLADKEPPLSGELKLQLAMEPIRLSRGLFEPLFDGVPPQCGHMQPHLHTSLSSSVGGGGRMEEHASVSRSAISLPSSPCNNIRSSSQDGILSHSCSMQIVDFDRSSAKSFLAAVTLKVDSSNSEFGDIETNDKAKSGGLFRRIGLDVVKLKARDKRLFERMVSEGKVGGGSKVSGGSKVGGGGSTSFEHRHAALRKIRSTGAGEEEEEEDESSQQHVLRTLADQLRQMVSPPSSIQNTSTPVDSPMLTSSGRQTSLMVPSPRFYTHKLQAFIEAHDDDLGAAEIEAVENVFDEESLHERTDNTAWGTLDKVNDGLKSRKNISSVTAAAAAFLTTPDPHYRTLGINDRCGICVFHDYIRRHEEQGFSAPLSPFLLSMLRLCKYEGMMRRLAIDNPEVYLMNGKSEKLLMEDQIKRNKQAIMFLRETANESFRPERRPEEKSLMGRGVEDMLIHVLQKADEFPSLEIEIEIGPDALEGLYFRFDDRNMARWQSVLHSEDGLRLQLERHDTQTMISDEVSGNFDRLFERVLRAQAARRDEQDHTKVFLKGSYVMRLFGDMTAEDNCYLTINRSPIESFESGARRVFRQKSISRYQFLKLADTHAVSRLVSKLQKAQVALVNVLTHESAQKTNRAYNYHPTIVYGYPTSLPILTSLKVRSSFEINDALHSQLRLAKTAEENWLQSAATSRSSKDTLRVHRRYQYRSNDNTLNSYPCDDDRESVVTGIDEVVHNLNKAWSNLPRFRRSEQICAEFEGSAKGGGVSFVLDEGQCMSSEAPMESECDDKEEDEETSQEDPHLYFKSISGIPTERKMTSLESVSSSSWAFFAVSAESIDRFFAHKTMLLRQSSRIDYLSEIYHSPKIRKPFRYCQNIFQTLYIAIRIQLLLRRMLIYAAGVAVPPIKARHNPATGTFHSHQIEKWYSQWLQSYVALQSRYLLYAQFSGLIVQAIYWIFSITPTVTMAEAQAKLSLCNVSVSSISVAVLYERKKIFLCTSMNINDRSVTRRVQSMVASYIIVRVLANFMINLALLCRLRGRTHSNQTWQSKVTTCGIFYLIVQVCFACADVLMHKWVVAADTAAKRYDVGEKFLLGVLPLIIIYAPEARVTTVLIFCIATFIAGFFVIDFRSIIIQNLVSYVLYYWLYASAAIFMVQRSFDIRRRCLFAFVNLPYMICLETAASYFELGAYQQKHLLEQVPLETETPTDDLMSSAARSLSWFSFGDIDRDPARKILAHFEAFKISPSESTLPKLN